VLAAVGLFEFIGQSRPLDGVPSGVKPPHTKGWGWNHLDLVAADGPADRYFNRLADAAEEWFDERPDDAAALAQRISELRQGCSTLILGKHQPLGETDRQWLLEKCRAWAAKLDQHLVALESGDDPADVRARADDTVRKLVEAIRGKAAERV
jgi:hypothetical protein